MIDLTKIKKMLKKVKCHFHDTCNYRGAPQLNCSLQYKENHYVQIIEHYSSDCDKNLNYFKDHRKILKIQLSLHGLKH